MSKFSIFHVNNFIHPFYNNIIKKESDVPASGTVANNEFQIKQQAYLYGGLGLHFGITNPMKYNFKDDTFANRSILFPQFTSQEGKAPQDKSYIPYISLMTDTFLSCRLFDSKVFSLFTPALYDKFKEHNDEGVNHLSLNGDFCISLPFRFLNIEKKSFLNKDLELVFEEEAIDKAFELKKIWSLAEFENHSTVKWVEHKTPTDIEYPLIASYGKFSSKNYRTFPSNKTEADFSAIAVTKLSYMKEFLNKLEYKKYFSKDIASHPAAIEDIRITFGVDSKNGRDELVLMPIRWIYEKLDKDGKPSEKDNYAQFLPENFFQFSSATESDTQILSMGQNSVSVMSSNFSRNFNSDQNRFSVIRPSTLYDWFKMIDRITKGIDLSEALFIIRTPDTISKPFHYMIAIPSDRTNYYVISDIISSVIHINLKKYIKTKDSFEV